MNEARKRNFGQNRRIGIPALACCFVLGRGGHKWFESMGGCGSLGSGKGVDIVGSDYYNNERLVNIDIALNKMNPGRNSRRTRRPWPGIPEDTLGPNSGVPMKLGLVEAAACIFHYRFAQRKDLLED